MRDVERVQDRFGVWPERLRVDTGYGSAEMLAWLVHDRDIHLHISVFDESGCHTAPSRNHTCAMT